MKRKLLLLLSLLIPFCCTQTKIVEAEAIDLVAPSKDCYDPESSSVKVLNNYEVLISNGFVYNSDNQYTYIVTSTNLNPSTNRFKIMYDNGIVRDAYFVGSTSEYGVSVLKTAKENSVKGVCFANSDYIYKGQTNYVYGYLNMESDFKIPTTLSQIGDVASRNGYIETYKSTINLEWSVILNGSGVFDQLNRLIGVVSGMPKGFNGASYIVNSNKLLKIIDSILKSGKYSLNYIKYNLEDYNNLPNFLKKSYGVNKNVNNGVVITVFKPLNYLFGGLNQGMVITAVNGVNVSSKYDLDRQLDRYPKESNVCLSVVKKNGNTTYYYVTI